MKTLGVVVGVVAGCASGLVGGLLVCTSHGKGAWVCVLIGCVMVLQAASVAHTAWEIATGRRVFRFTKEEL